MNSIARKILEKRQHERFDLGRESVLHTRRVKRAVVIENISVKGMKVVCPPSTIPLEHQLFMNQDVEIEWAPGEKITGMVVWSIRDTAGLFFNTALPEDHPLIEIAKKKKGAGSRE